MKSAIILLTWLISPSVYALTCGYYQVEDFGDRVLYSITRFKPSPSGSTVQTHYTITNPGTELVRRMSRGLCYCVTGPIVPDPEFDGDQNFQLITIETIEGRPFIDCGPSARP